MRKHLQNKSHFVFLTALYAFFFLWWILIQLTPPNLVLVEGITHDTLLQWFGSLYFVVALTGGIFGLVNANKWGGWKSLLGKALILFSLGLLAQVFGQIAYSYYIYVLNMEVPYPSIGDIGYFGSIPLYIYGTVLLAKASGVHIGIKSMQNKIQAVVIPLVLLIFCYLLFLQHYQFDWSSPLVIFLDFGYPMGQAIYISLAILVYLLSRNILGGMMKKGISYIIVALFAQYSADYLFLYQVSRNMWNVEGINEVLYLTAYYLMALSLLKFGDIYKSVRSNKN
jgi:hypothetical protein